jgi:tetratricopeptide (TPR) repeat protein
MASNITPAEEAQLLQTIEMFEVITQSQPQDYQSLEILKEAYFKLGRQKDVVSCAKRIAEAYVQSGQLSSAIMEYETILQRFPDDPDVKKALEDIEKRASTSATPAAETFTPLPPSGPTSAKPGAKASAADVDDGKQVMQKIFVDGKLINASDFNLYWVTPDSNEPEQVIEPFLQVLADKAVMPVDKSVKLITEKSRLGYLPMEKYDVDIELARSFSKAACRRWCVLPVDKMSKSVLVATTNPFNRQAAIELQASTKLRLLWYIASPPELVKAIKKVFR